MKRKICTKDNPYKPGEPGNWQHPDAEYIYESDYFEYYECPNCGIKFKVTIYD